MPNACGQCGSETGSFSLARQDVSTNLFDLECILTFVTGFSLTWPHSLARLNLNPRLFLYTMIPCLFLALPVVLVFSLKTIETDNLYVATILYSVPAAALMDTLDNFLFFFAGNNDFYNLFAVDRNLFNLEALSPLRYSPSRLSGFRNTLIFLRLYLGGR